jgi:hypothetical protein
MNEQTTYNKEYKKPISDPTDRKQNFINFQAKQIEKLIKENRRLIQLQKEIKNPVGFSVVNGQSIYLPDKDLKSQIAVYSLWVLQQCEYPIEEIEWLVDLILKENPNSKIEMLDVLKVHKNEL